MSINIAEDCCFHCGLPNEDAQKYQVVINDVPHAMCCPGCQAVAQAIVDNGLVNYYEFRTEPAARGDSALSNTMAQLSVYDEPDLQEEFVFDQGKHKQIQLTVEGITCAACGWLIEKQLAKLKGIKQVSVNVSARRALISWQPDQIKLSEILSRLKSIGYESLPFQPDTHEASYKKEHKAFLKKLGLAGIMTMQVMMLAMGQYFDIFGNIDDDAISYFNAVSLLLTTPVVLYSGSIFYISALKAVQAKTVNMDVPVTIAIVATYIAGVLAVNKNTGEVYFESICMFVFFLLISRFLEHRSRHRASLISSNMLKLIPITANRLENSIWKSVLAKQLIKGDMVIVKPGESVPVDGYITEGKSLFDESMLTGEFEPVTKSVGDKVYAGSLNQQGSIIVKVSASVKHAMMNQILRLQENALANKPKVAAVADKLSRFFVIIVLAVAIATYLFWYYQGSEHAFWITISVLVATCPCALGLATPSALTCAMAKLNQLGILLKRADALEQITGISDIVFDKTGTLTKGEFSIQKTWLNESFSNELCDTFGLPHTTNEQLVMHLASIIEMRSEHPIAKAFVDANQKLGPLSLSQKKWQALKDINVTNLNIEIGKGVSSNIYHYQCHIGSKKFIQEKLDRVLQIDDITALKGANVIFAMGNQVLAGFWVTDTLADDVTETLKQLKAFKTTILSGDTQANAEIIAKQLGINNVIGDSSPAQKLDYVNNMQKINAKTLMLGDGINDAPVLAAADVSIAVGNASDLAKNAADVVLLNPKLNMLSHLINLAFATKRKIKQNIAWALGYNILVIPFAVLGLLTPWQAALGMSLSSIIVVYNSTRLMR
ncbi:heavy metal translocating P-type ATPase [Glaciecola petra]|uniref:Heavy metal translocating P-type ATPase n=1 Tax=Glaciecola petra TaxID=3075602 RepID=A0ABU2ZNQ4_9ALTE|nr:heavy metal translocating P-type ATPase [Aestuariibacter sp. P117]MDT0594253.1 heavy metal translocating P-type ATPase [Aestuariibacter sp. P117]